MHNLLNDCNKQYDIIDNTTLDPSPLREITEVPLYQLSYLPILIDQTPKIYLYAFI